MIRKEPNTFLVQFQGPFTPEDDFLEAFELNEEIHNDFTEFRFIKKIGIQITPEIPFEIQVLLPEKDRHYIQIGSDKFIIGPTGILEIDNLRLTKKEMKDKKIHFLQKENELTLVDFILDTNIIDNGGGK